MQPVVIQPRECRQIPPCELVEFMCENIQNYPRLKVKFNKHRLRGKINVQ